MSSHHWRGEMTCIARALRGAFFQMWQVEAGASALRDASLYALQHGVVWLIIRADD